MWQEHSSDKRRDLYILFEAIKDRRENLGHESQKLLDRILLEYEESGTDRSMTTVFSAGVNA
jgi:hypothetical protein